MLDWLPGLGVALIGIIPGVLVWRQAANARDEAAAQQRYAQGLDARKVDQAAFDAARGIYEAGLLEARRQIAQCTERALLQEREIGRKDRRVDVLELQLRQAGVEVPPEEEGR